MTEQAQTDDLVQVRREGVVLQIDMSALVTLIQQQVLDARTEVSSKKLTSGAWRPLGELELFRTLRPQTAPDGEKPETPLPPAAAPADRYEQNLVRFFQSVALSQLRVDSALAMTAAIVIAVVGMIAHRWFVLLPVLLAGGWGGATLYANRFLFPGWFRSIRLSGFRRLPWSSRAFVVMAVALLGYFLIILFLPELPGESLFRFVDSVVAFLFGAAGGAIWTFRRNAFRMKRVFEKLPSAETRDPELPQSAS